MARAYLGVVVLILGLMAASPTPAYGQARQLSAAELARIQGSVDKSKSRAQLAAQQQAAIRQQEQARRQQEAALAEADAGWEADPVEAAPAPSFADAIAHGLGVFQDEMAKKDAEQAAANARLAQIRRQAEAIDRDRERQREQQAQREREARERQQQRAQQAVAAQVRTNEQAVAAQDRERQLRENITAERQRLAAQQQQAARAESERQAKAQADEQAQKRAEQQRLATAAAAAESQRKAEAARKQGLRQAEQSLRSGFSGRAATCIGGGKAVLYLQSSHPSRTGCNVSFEARCPGTPSGAGTRFSQANYVGGSCQGLGDNIRIGEMACAANQVQVAMTDADCGADG